jgi:HEPN domain-containing protein
MRKQTAKWVRKAEADLVGARKLVQQKEPLHDLVCFHCQQSAEKYLKAMVQESGLAVPRIHDLGALLLALLPRDGTLLSLRRKLLSLNKYSVEIRYPDKSASKREAVAAVRNAEKIRRDVRARLGLPT